MYPELIPSSLPANRANEYINLEKKNIYTIHKILRNNKNNRYNGMIFLFKKKKVLESKADFDYYFSFSKGIIVVNSLLESFQEK
jgi:hypothetical protein